MQLRTQAMVTPACGLAGHGVSQAARAMKLATTVAMRVTDQAVGRRGCRRAWRQVPLRGPRRRVDALRAEIR